MRKEGENPFFAKISASNTIDWGDLHQFNFDFCTRYAKQLSEGVDLRFVFEYELSCFETGLNCFHLGQKYTNEEGETMTVVDRREDMLVIEYNGEFYGVDYFYEGNIEYCIMNNIEWSVKDIQANK